MVANNSIPQEKHKNKCFLKKKFFSFQQQSKGNLKREFLIKNLFRKFPNLSYDKSKLGDMF